MKKELEPVVDEVQVKLTYFQDDIHIKPNVFEVEYYEYDESGKYLQPFDIAVSYGMNRGYVSYFPEIKFLPVLTDFNGLELEKEITGRGFYNGHQLTFDSKMMESDIIKLVPSYHISTKSYEEDVFKIDVLQLIITDLDTIQAITGVGY